MSNPYRRHRRHLLELGETCEDCEEYAAGLIDAEEWGRRINEPKQLGQSLVSGIAEMFGLDGRWS